MVGESGSGKSTLARALTGLVAVRRRDRPTGPPHHVRRSGWIRPTAAPCRSCSSIPTARSIRGTGSATSAGPAAALVRRQRRPRSRACWSRCACPPIHAHALSAPALGRREAARRHRPRLRRAARAGHLRRDHRARSTCRVQASVIELLLELRARARHRLSVHHPRPEPGAPDRASPGGDAPRRAGRSAAVATLSPAPGVAPLHARADRRLPTPVGWKETNMTPDEICSPASTRRPASTSSPHGAAQELQPDAGRARPRGLHGRARCARWGWRRS